MEFNITSITANMTNFYSDKVCITQAEYSDAIHKVCDLLNNELPIAFLFIALLFDMLENALYSRLVNEVYSEHTVFKITGKGILFMFSFAKTFLIICAIVFLFYGRNAIK